MLEPDCSLADSVLFPEICRVYNLGRLVGKEIYYLCSGGCVYDAQLVSVRCGHVCIVVLCTNDFWLVFVSVEQLDLGKSLAPLNLYVCEVHVLVHSEWKVNIPVCSCNWCSFGLINKCLD